MALWQSLVELGTKRHCLETSIVVDDKGDGGGGGVVLITMMIMIMMSIW